MDHPPYNTMITEAIATLADRSGSSLAAIKKHIGTKYKLKEGWERKVLLCCRHCNSFIPDLLVASSTALIQLKTNTVFGV